jgi:4-hydroxy-tetrahydrodipicolinate reductase
MLRDGHGSPRHEHPAAWARPCCGWPPSSPHAGGRRGDTQVRRQRVVDGVPHFAASELAGVPAFDVAIDFSLPEGFDPLLACAWTAARRWCRAPPAGCGAAAALARRRPASRWLWASNFSLGVAVLAELVERAAAALPGWDCDIVESHHVHKKDAPSGTALTLGQAAGRVGPGGALRQPARRRHRRRAPGPVHRAGRTDRAGASRHQPRHFRPGRLHAARRWWGAPGAYRVRDLLD